MGQLLYADAIHRVEQAKIDAARLTQKSGNERRGSETALAQFSASLGNKRRMDAAGSAVNDSAANSVRTQRQLTTGRLSGRIRAAEELGQAAAMAAAAGVGGASVDTYNETTRLVNAMREQQVERSFSEQEWAAGQQRGNAIKAAVAGLDNTTYRANLDYTQYIDHKKPSFIERAVGIAGTVAATVFGGPQAGSAVMGMFEARQAARNGDFANASNSLVGAFKNGMGAMRSGHLTSGDTAKGTVEVENASSWTQQPTPEQLERHTRLDFDNPFRSAPSWGSITIK